MKPTHLHSRLHLAMFVLALAPQASHAAVTWDAGAGGGDLNWSTFTNWSDEADPATKDIVFNNTGGAAGSTVTSILGSSSGINSMNFRQDNTLNQTLSISSEQTLSVTGSFTPTGGAVTAVLFGQPNSGGTTNSTTTITGLGTFTVNNSAAHFLVGYANATTSPTITADMSGLASFNATTNIFGVGREGMTNASTPARQQAGRIFLAKSSTITATQISVGDTTSIDGTAGTWNNGGVSTLYLAAGGGAVSNLNADTVTFGKSKAVGNMNFAPGAVASDLVTIRNKAGTGAVGTFEICYRNMSSSSGTPGGAVDFGAGRVDAQINNLYIARWGATGAGNNISPSATFTTGTNGNSNITVTTANLALDSTTNAPATAQMMTANLNVTGGVFSATTLNLSTGNNTANLTRAANLTVDGGTFRFGSFGTPVGGYNINFNSGTVASVNTTDRTLALNYKLGKADGGTTVVFGQASGGTGTITLNGAGTLLGHTTIETVQNTSIGGALTGAFNLTKTGSATLNISNSGSLGGGNFSLKSTATGPSTTLGLSGGLTVVNPIEKDSTTGREMILSTGTGNNALTGGMTITGAGANALVIANNQTSGNLTFSGGISGPGYLGSVSLRGTQAGAVGFFNGVVNIASALQNNGSTDWTVNSAGSTWSETQIINAGGFILGGDNALALGARVYWTNAGKLDLAGYVQSVAGLLTANTAANVFNSSATADSTLTLANLAGDLTYAGTISDGATKKVSLVMNSAGRIQNLTGANTYSGGTTVTAGTLSLAQVNLSNEASTVSIATGATLDLAFTDTDTVNKLFINGVQQAAGIYVKAGTETAPEIGIAGITGTGKLNVTSNPVVASGFASWIDTPSFALTAGQKGPADDPDNDGMANLLEFVLNGNPAVSDASILPDPGITTSDFVFTFQRRDDSLSPETTQTFQYGGDLSGWTNVLLPATSGTVGNAIITISAGIPDDGITDTVKVAIPKTEATDGKLFGRLQVSQP